MMNRILLIWVAVRGRVGRRKDLSLAAVFEFVGGVTMPSQLLVGDGCSSLDGGLFRYSSGISLRKADSLNPIG